MPSTMSPSKNIHALSVKLPKLSHTAGQTIIRIAVYFPLLSRLLVLLFRPSLKCLSWLLLLSPLIRLRRRDPLSHIF
jgi:hypothetical protein